MSFRSLLFVPGARPERFEKALAAGADQVCIDLEDAVPPPQKDEARAAVAAFVGGRPEFGVRINAPRTAWGAADIAAIAAIRPAFVMVPKVAHPVELDIVREATGAARIVPIVESADGLKNAFDICAAQGVAAVLFGGFDFAADIGCTMDWEPLLFARSTLATACARAGVELMDVPYLDVDDASGLMESTKRARALGFTGRACIHPKQVDGVKAAFAPSADEIAHAKRVIAAFEAADGAAALLDGKLVELPVIRASRRILAAAGEA